LQPLIRRLVADRNFQEELDRFKDPKGSVSGRVVLGERLSSIRPIIQVTDVRMTTQYDRVPFPLTIDGGKIAYEGVNIEISDLKGALGASSFLGLTGRLVLGEAPEAGIDSGQARLSMDELVPWLSSTDLAREALENVKSARGTVEVSSVSAGGPLGAMKEWRYEVSGRVNDLVLELARLPGPVTVQRGGFHLLPRSASLSGFEAELLDAKARGSADIRYSPGGISQVTASLEEGKVGAAMTEWASPRLQLAPGFGIRAPLSVSAVAFTWERDGPVSFRGDLAHPDGAVLSISLRKTPAELAIDNLVVRDQDSDADLAMHLGPKEMRLKYRGTLYSSTVEKFATTPARPFQRLKGDLELSVDRKSPERSVARGTLEGEEIRIPWKPLDPLRIRSVSLSADGREIRVASADLAWREVPFRLRGKGSFSRDGLEADVDVETGDVPLERLLPETPGATETAAGSGGPPVADAGYRLPKLPVRGVFRLRSDSIRYDRWTVRSVAARGELGPAGLLVTVSEADLCGFPLRLSANLDSGGLALELNTMASGPEINPPLLCLFDKAVSMTGSFQFATRLSARGRDQESLLRSNEGPVEYTAWNGRIYKMEGLSRTLSLLNAGNVIRGQLPDLRTEGLPFDIFSIKGDYWAQVFLLGEGTLHGPTLGIVWTGEIFLRTSEVNFKVLAAPFSTADWIIEHIPGLSYIMGKTLVSVPLKVEGKLGDPRVSFDTIGVGTGLLGVLERTIKLPAKVVEGALPESKPSK
jgi:hypothetical protein